VYYSLPFILSLLTAFIDETLQIFSGRGPMVQDIWLDLAGSLFGAGIIRLILLIIDNKKRKKETGQ
jgi:VanZ family protein